MNVEKLDMKKDINCDKEIKKVINPIVWANFRVDIHINEHFIIIYIFNIFMIC